MGAAAATNAIGVRVGEGRGVLQDVVHRAADSGFSVIELSTERAGHGPGVSGDGDLPPEGTLLVRGSGPAQDLAVGLSEVPG